MDKQVGLAVLGVPAEGPAVLSLFPGWPHPLSAVGLPSLWDAFSLSPVTTDAYEAWLQCPHS